jgi:hypothetical protein
MLDRFSSEKELEIPQLLKKVVAMLGEHALYLEHNKAV